MVMGLTWTVYVTWYLKLAVGYGKGEIKQKDLSVI